MKKSRALLCIVFVIIILSVFTCVSFADESAVPFKNGSAFIEAEQGKLKSYCHVIDDENASGKKALVLGERNGNRASSPMQRVDMMTEYRFSLDYASRVYVYVRIKAPDVSCDQVSIIINGVNATGRATEYGKYHWIQLGERTKGYHLSSGEHILKLVPVTDGITVDEILITRKTGTPRGTDIMDDTLTTDVRYTQYFDLNDIGYSKTVLINERKYDISEIKPVKEHPRIYFTKEDIPRILENAQKRENQSAWETHLKYVADRSEKPSVEVLEAQALDYALRGNVEAGKNAVKEALEFFKDNGKAYAALTGDTYNIIGMTVYTLSAVYDWCYDLFTPEERQYLIDEMIMLMWQGNNGELGWPPTTENAFTTHMGEGYLQHDVMSMAIAVYDERPDIFNFVAGRFFNEFVEYRQWMFKGQYSNQGNNYLHYRFKWEMRTTYLLDSGLGIENIYGDGIAGVFMSALYLRRPDGFEFPDGDYQAQSWAISSMGSVGTWLAASYYGEPYLKQAYLESSGNAQFKVRSSVSNQQVTTSQWLIFNDPNLEPRALRELPLTKYYPSPAGNMTARTGWTFGSGSKDVVALMKLDEYTVNGHDHKDSGSFMLYYKGYLAREAGTYKITNIGYRTDNIGSSEFLSHHHSFFYTKAIAHNCMRVYDPDEKFYGDRSERDRGSNISYWLDEHPNDGGQKQNINDTNYVTDFKDVYCDDHKTAEVLGYEYGEDRIEPDYSYLKGDLSYAYSDKVSEYERSFMFLNMKNEDCPAALIVFDRIKTSDPSFKKTWQLYGPEYPEISGTRVTFEDVRSEQEGKWEYNGKLTLDTLLPVSDNAGYNVVGGEGQWALVDGEDYPAQMGTNTRPEYENWRLELSPKADAELDYFLNVMQVGDADGKEPLDVSLIETKELAGCVIGDRAVVFGKRRNRTSQATEFEFDGDGIFNISVCDMQAGTWSVYRNGLFIGDYGATEDGGIVALKGESGAYRFVYKNTIPKVYAGPEIEKQSRISVYYDGLHGYTSEAPYLKNDGQIMVPARSVLEYAGADVDWDEETETAMVANGEVTVYFKEGSNIAQKNVGDMTYGAMLSAEPVIKNGTLMLSLDTVKSMISGFEYEFADISHRLDIHMSQMQNSTEIIRDNCTLLKSDETQVFYKLNSPAFVQEILLNGNEAGKVKIAYSLDGESWTGSDSEINVSTGQYMASGIGQWCNFIRLSGDWSVVGDIMFIGNEYTDNVYDKIFDVEWSKQNNNNETGKQAVDGNTSTLWSAEGDNEFLIFDLGIKNERSGVEIMWNKGNERQAYFEILGSDDGENWTEIISDGVSSGTTLDFEAYNFENKSTYRYYKLDMFGTSTGKWNAVKEIRFLKRKGN